MHAKVVVLRPVAGGALTYAVPGDFEGRLLPGHRVVVPLRSRKVTGLVLETGVALDPAIGKLRPIAALLDDQPLYDRPHLELLQFMASYYMAPLAAACHSVVPAIARVESRAGLRLLRRPTAIERVALTPLDLKLIESLAAGWKRTSALDKLGNRTELRASLERLEAQGILGRHEATSGRHREAAPLVVRLRTGSPPIRLRGARQLEIVRILEQAGSKGLSTAELESRVSGARPIWRALSDRGVIELVSGLSSSGATADSAPGAVPTCFSVAAPAVNGGDPAFSLNAEQQRAVDAVAPAVTAPRFEAFLLWGVTASGKTEVYLRLARMALECGGQVLVLVPEIALADELVASFRARFGDLAVVAHSALGVAERWAGWMAALSGRARIMIGPRSAIFAPLAGLRLVVVDEEHDAGYKQEEGVGYHARDLAVALGRFARCPVVLGSATPSAESFANAKGGRYRLLRLSSRIGERPMARVELVDLRARASDGGAGARAAGATSGARAGGATSPDSIAAHRAAEQAPSSAPLSRELVSALRENVARGEQSILFLNRRGFYSFLQCHLCGTVLTCPNCSVSMTFHLRDRSLRCHYCNHRDRAPDDCPGCSGYGLGGQGFGTEQLARLLGELLPAARIERMDSDTSGRKGARGRILAALRRGEIDILVGTQMVTKGFDFPNVTLVGVVLADLTLNLPDFRAAERTFQLLTQVAGRAGRGDLPGRVLIQTYAPGHYSVRAARDQDYARFIRRELALRRELGYPPYVRLALVRVGGDDSAAAAELAARAANMLRAAGAESLSVLGPAPAPIERLRGRYRWQVLVKSARRAPMERAIGAMREGIAAKAQRNGVYLGVDIDPVNMM